MTFDLFKKIVDDIHKYSFMLLLWNQGEPFLNSDYCKMIEYANSKGMFLMSSSNVNISTNHEEIISSGLDIMLVSLDGTTQEVYNKYRANGDLSLVLENIRSLVLAKKKLKKSYPLIVTQFLVMKHNEHQIEEFKKLSNDIGADEFVFKTVQIYSKDDIKEFLPSNPKFRRYKISGDDFELKFGLKNRCHRIWFQPVINWDGEIAVCCFFKDNEYKIGNIQEKTFFELWKSDRFMTFMQNILQKRSDYEICRNCGEGVSLQIKKL
jgi:radical SAM protein with 4Fe4S-binding SPASM domain